MLTTDFLLPMENKHYDSAAFSLIKNCNSLISYSQVNVKDVR